LGASSASSAHQPAVIVKQLLRPVAAHPGFELLDVLGVLGVDQQRHLVGAERALDLDAVNDLRSGPALG
jgi:hypothetical protein